MPSPLLLVVGASMPGPLLLPPAFPLFAHTVGKWGGGFAVKAHFGGCLQAMAQAPPPPNTKHTLADTNGAYKISSSYLNFVTETMFKVQPRNLCRYCHVNHCLDAEQAYVLGPVIPVEWLLLDSFYGSAGLDHPSVEFSAPMVSLGNSECSEPLCLGQCHHFVRHCRSGGVTGAPSHCGGCSMHFQTGGTMSAGTRGACGVTDLIPLEKRWIAPRPAQMQTTEAGTTSLCLSGSADACAAAAAQRCSPILRTCLPLGGKNPSQLFSWWPEDSSRMGPPPNVNASGPWPRPQPVFGQAPVEGW